MEKESGVLGYSGLVHLVRRGWLLRVVYCASFLSLAALLLSSRGYSPDWNSPHRFWDVAIYYRAMQDVHAGLDPYAAGLQRQSAAQAAGQHYFTYIYPPLTLLALRAFNRLPLWLAAFFYWAAYCASIVAGLWAVTRCFRPQDKPVMKYFVPLAIFFPALMPGNNIIGGNIAYIFYGWLFAATILGWKRGTWLWFYLAVLLASSFKAPFLTMLAIPALAGTRQWLKTAAVGAAGLGLFAVQAWLWPTQFREYLTSVNLQFRLNPQFVFGQSIAGNLGRALYLRGLPYTTLPALIFFIYASVLFAVLFRFSRLYHQHRISPQSWIPVLLVATIVLNPRIADYDVLLIALPMALILVRSVAARSKSGMALAITILFLIVADLFLDLPASVDAPRDMLVLLAILGVGFQYLVAEARRGCQESLIVLPQVTAVSEPAAADKDA
ncbi:MAG: glycosyltransferase family 87 protein [Terriglobales bacterium]